MLRGGDFKGCCMQSAAESLPGAPGHQGAINPALLPQPTVSSCLAQESYCQRMGCLHAISLWPSTYQLFSFIKAFSLVSSPPRTQAMVLRGKEPPVALRPPHSQSESQTYRIIRFVRNLWRSSSLSPLPRQGHRLCRSVLRWIWAVSREEIHDLPG